MKKLIAMFKYKKITKNKIIFAFILNLLSFLIFNFDNNQAYLIGEIDISLFSKIYEFLIYLTVIVGVFMLLVVNQYNYNNKIIGISNDKNNYKHYFVYIIICYFIGIILCDFIIVTSNIVYLSIFKLQSISHIFLPIIHSFITVILYSCITFLIIFFNYYYQARDTYNIFTIVQFIICLFLYLLSEKSTLIFLLFIITLASCLSSVSFYTSKIFLYSLKSRSNTIYIIDKFSSRKFYTYFSFIFISALTVYIVVLESLKDYLLESSTTNLVCIILGIVIGLIGIVFLAFLYLINRKNFIEGNKYNIDILSNMNVSKAKLTQLMNNNILLTFFVSTFYTFIMGFLYLTYLKDNISIELFEYFKNFKYSDYLIFAIIYIILFFCIINLGFEKLSKLFIRGDDNE